jgi:hypothetical protein
MVLAGITAVSPASQSRRLWSHVLPARQANKRGKMIAPLHQCTLEVKTGSGANDLLHLRIHRSKDQ